MDFSVQHRIPKPLLPAYTKARQAAQNVVFALSRRIDRRKLDEESFREILIANGFCPGAVVMIHSSMDQICRRVPAMTPSKFIGLLLELLTAEGTLLMPTFPFIGYQAAYVRSNTLFDARRTISRMGLVTELFRRRRDVERSLHPTHSVAGWGKHAHDLLKSHHLGDAYAETSPFQKLSEHDGVVISVGVHPKTCFSLFHVPEYIDLPTRQHHYETLPYSMTIREGGQEITYEGHAHRADRRRNFSRASRILIREGILKHGKYGGLEVGSTRVRDFIRRSFELIKRRRYYS